MPYSNPATIIEAKQMDLLTYLQIYEPQELMHVAGDVYCTRTHDSLKISNGKWCWFSQGIGGRSALDYLIKVQGLSFVQAVEQITGQAAARPPVFLSQSISITKSLVLPHAYRNAAKVTHYLRERGISSEIIAYCIQTGRLYESSPHHNAVFVGFDTQNKPRYATLRGICGTRFMGEAVGSDKHYSFSFPTPQSDTLHLFESAIDLLSYATLKQSNGEDWLGENLLSLAGIYQAKKNSTESKVPAALEQFLNDYPYIQKIAFHLDNDTPGRMATKAMIDVLPKIVQVSDDPPPIGKDYNDYLCHCLGLPQKFKNERNEAR